MENAKNLLLQDDADTYASWGSYAVLYNKKSGTFTIKCPGKNDAIQAQIVDILLDGKSVGGVEDFGKCTCISQRSKTKDSVFLAVKYTEGTDLVSKMSLKFIVSDEGIRLSFNLPKGCTIKLSGSLTWGDGSFENTYPMGTGKDKNIIRSAVGPASSLRDNMLFDRLSDNALMLNGGKKIRIKYDWEKQGYQFEAETGTQSGEKTIKIAVMKDIMANQYHIDYKPLSRERVLKKTPVGWMTWYAVMFDACEERVLKNTKWMSENLKDYGANSVWVDWEWYHKDMTGTRSDGVDTFHPDKEKYPHGLKYLSDKIREYGMEPALWAGFTNDVAMNEYAKENPEIVFLDEETWCGKYFFDFTHPKYLNEFLPKAFAKVREWGYDVIKYDTLPLAMMMHEKYHNRLYDSSKTMKEAYRTMIEKTREIVGEDCYLLSCAATNDADVLWGVGVFDSARIGEDIFTWDQFLRHCVGRVVHFYPLHNHALYPDVDNVVMREEYNDIDQAASRINFISMLGVPITFGDEFDALDDARIGFIKRCLPVLDIHPMDIYKKKPTTEIIKMDLAIEKEWESYHVLNVFNPRLSEGKCTVSLNKDMGLEPGKYLVYDYTRDKFIGIEESEITVSLKACESRIFSIREKLNHPQIISTSRHISQGAAEIEKMVWDDDTLEFTIDANLIGKALYKITIYVPDGYSVPAELEKVQDNVYQLSVMPERTGVERMKIRFQQV